MPFVTMPDGSRVEVGLDAIYNDPEGQNPFVVPATPQGRVFTEEDVARIREEEKNKLYGRIEELGTKVTDLTNQIGGLTAEQQREKAALEAEQARLEAEARAHEESELDAKSLIEKRTEEWNRTLAEKEQSWKSELDAERQKREEAEALRAKEAEFASLRDHTLARIEENRDRIAPQFLPFITGNTPDEIDAAIAQAVSATDEITAEFQQMVGQQQPGLQYGQVPAPQQIPVPVGTRPTSGPTSFDPSGSAQQTLSAEDIKNMSITEYQKLRQQIGIGGQSNNRGLFG